MNVDISMPDGKMHKQGSKRKKIAAVERPIKRYDINLIAFIELNYNWSKFNSSANLASWLDEEEQELRSIMAHNAQ
jgi:hypothetical protein